MKKRLGIIDSGIGGLSLLDGMSCANLNLDYFYCSDNKNVPYGEKTQAFMVQRVVEMVEGIKKKNVDAILLACNTLTAQTIDLLRDKYSLPFIGIEPYINFYNLLDPDQSKLVLILTKATFDSARFKKLRDLKDPHHKVDVFTPAHLAVLIESCKGNFQSHRKILKEELELLKDKNYTHCILGCTHYPFVKEFIANYLNLEVIDPTEHVVKEVRRVLDLGTIKKSQDKFEYSTDCAQSWNKTSFHYIKSLYY